MGITGHDSRVTAEAEPVRRQYIEETLSGNSRRLDGMAGFLAESIRKSEVILPIPNPHGSGEISVPNLKEILHEVGIRTDGWLSVTCFWV